MLSTEAAAWHAVSLVTGTPFSQTLLMPTLLTNVVQTGQVGGGGGDGEGGGKGEGGGGGADSQGWSHAVEPAAEHMPTGQVTHVCWPISGW